MHLSNHHIFTQSFPKVYVCRSVSDDSPSNVSRLKKIRAAWQSMDAVDMSFMLQHLPGVMRSVPHFLQGPLRNAMLMASEEACHPERFAQGTGMEVVHAVAKVVVP